jgi:hypothetical protein
MQSAQLRLQSLEVKREPAGGARPHILFLAAYSAVLFVITIPIAKARLLWNDELFTLSVARHSFHEIWQVLRSGADQMPVGFYAITRPLLSLGGNVELFLRLPEIAAFWMMGICLYWFVARRTSPIHGAIAAFLPVLTESFTYSFEARSYGLMLGFVGMALVAWQTANENDDPKWIVAFAFSLMAAIAVHYYAVLALVPFGVAEGARWWRERRARVGMWVGITAALVPLAIAVPVIRTGLHMTKEFWANVRGTSLLNAYVELLGTPFLTLLVLGSLGAFCYALLRPVRFDRRVPPPRFDEIVVVSLFAMLPILGVALAKASIGTFTSRYVAGAVPAICILLVWAIYRFSAAHRSMALLVLSAVIALAILRGWKLYRSVSADRADKAMLTESLARSQPGSIPLVISDPHLFVQLSYYASGSLARRFVYPADVRLAERYNGTPTVDNQLITMAPILGDHVTFLEQFLNSTPQFLVYGHPGDWEWLVPELVQRHIPVRAVGPAGGRLVYLAGEAPK